MAFGSPLCRMPSIKRLPAFRMCCVRLPKFRFQVQVPEIALLKPRFGVALFGESTSVFLWLGALFILVASTLIVTSERKNRILQ